MNAAATNEHGTPQVEAGALTLPLAAGSNRLLARAAIVPGKSITLHGVEAPGRRYIKDPQTGKFDAVLNRPLPYANPFAIGDWAEVGAYRLVYTGRITKITARTVTLVEHPDTRSAKTYRFTIAEFDARNWDFDLEKAKKRNSEWND